MASYQELHELSHNGNLLDKIEIAIGIAAYGIIGGAASNQASLNKWAESALSNPRTMANRFLPGILAANKDATPQQILDATDMQMQTNVDSLIDLFADLMV